LDSRIWDIGDGGEWGLRVQEARYEALRKIEFLAMEEEVDMVLIAGDVYDASYRSLRAQLAFRDLLERLCSQEIQCLIVHGNHDPLDGWDAGLSLPENAHVFSPQGDTMMIRKDGKVKAAVHGVSHPRKGVTEDLSALLPHRIDGAFNIGLLHCNLGGVEGHDDYAPTSVETLRTHGYDYWALGHVHAATVACMEPPMVYPGTTQGGGFGEQGMKGVKLVKVRGGEVIIEDRPTSSVEYVSFPIDISGMENIDELVRTLRGSIDRLEVPSVVRISISGRGRLHDTLMNDSSKTDLMADLRGLRQDVLVTEVRVQTSPDLDLEMLASSPDLIGDLMRAAEGMRSPDRLIEALLSAPESRKVREHLAELKDDDLFRILDRAKMACLDRLLEEGR
jgi:exonuclease SbcD